MKKLCVVVLTAVFLMGVAGTVWTSTGMADAKALVEKAAAFLKANGKEKTLAELSKPKGQFDKGELYVFAYDMNAVIIAHPKNPELIGKNMSEIPDNDGKYFRKEIVELAKTKGTGTVKYKYLNPETKKVESKITYIQRVNDVILCCGVYK